MLVLGVETSCDETAIGIVEDRFTLRANVVASQAELHGPYGGVVPEVAARAHLELMLPTIDRALVEAGAHLSDIDAIAVTAGPGLIGALLVGVSAAKGLALAHDLPLVGVNHLRAHVEAAQLEVGALEPPLAALVVSGGHTSIVVMDADGSFRQLGATIDDAAGEAFDKVAAMLGLGFPGGQAVSRLAAEGNPSAYRYPRSMIREDHYDFSFSGLKTAVRYSLVGPGHQDFASLRLPREVQADVCASFEAAVVDVLVAKCRRAVAAEGCPRLIVGGGVAANARLRAELGRVAAEDRFELVIAPPQLCTDNAVMGALAWEKIERGQYASPDLDIRPGLQRGF